MLLAGATAVFAALDKQQSHDDMQAIAAQMRALKPTASQSGNSGAYAALEAQYNELSRQMGGDDPAGLLPGGQPVDGRAPQGAGGGPNPPPGCVVTEDTFTNNTPVAIPTGPAVVSSTQVVSGAGTWLFDLDLTTSITHTFAADLDITLMSPAGTIVTLTTDNGGGNDNVFNGTLWDDDANPGGQVPYTTNNGMVTDHAYANLTLASPLVPEEAMGAFIGEDPNGTWTVTISDDLAGDGGSLNDWTLTVRTLPAPPVVANTTATNNTPVAIPTGPAVVSSTILIAGAGTAILDVDATTFITHTFAADLDVTLESPAGTVVTLTSDNGGSNDNVYNGTVWDDDANPLGQVPYTTNNGLVTDHLYANLTLASPLVPEEALAAFIGEDPNGTWTITISDDLAGDGGSLDSWSLDIDTATCVLPDADLEVIKDGVVGGGQATWTITVTNNGPDDATGVVVTDPLDACSSFISDDCGGMNVPPWTWNVGALANGASAVCNITVDTTGCAGGVSNTATVVGNENDPDPGNNSSTAVGQPPALEIPALGTWGLALLALGLAALGVWLMRRRLAGSS